MVTVTPNHIGYIAVYPLFEEVIAAVIAGLPLVPTLYPLTFRELPFVARLVHDEKAYTVRYVIYGGSLRIVAHSQGIDSEFLQAPKTALPHLFRHYRSQCTGIMMDAYTLHFHVFPVEGESGVRVKAEFTYAYRYLG